MGRIVPRELLAAYQLRVLGVSVSLQEYADELPARLRDDLLLLAECAAAGGIR